MFIGKTDSRRRLTVSLSVSSALLGLVVFMLLSAAPATIYAAELAPFSSDGCSLFPEGSGENSDLWLSCCRAHDLSYWRGGTRAELEKAGVSAQRIHPLTHRLLALFGMRFKPPFHTSFISNLLVFTLSNTLLCFLLLASCFLLLAFEFNSLG